MSIEELRLKNQGLVGVQQNISVNLNNTSEKEADTSGYIIDGSSASDTDIVLVSVDDVEIGVQLDTDNPFSKLDDSTIKSEYMSLDKDNDGILTKEELLAWDGIIDGINGTLENLKDIFSGMGLRVADSSSIVSSPQVSSTGENVSINDNAQTVQVNEEIMPDAVRNE